MPDHLQPVPEPQRPAKREGAEAAKGARRISPLKEKSGAIWAVPSEEWRVVPCEPESENFTLFLGSIGMASAEAPYTT